MKNPNWLADLVDYLDQAEALAFEPGRHDCALFVAGAIAVLYGVDLAADFRGQYQTIEQGLALVQAAGLADHLEIVASELDAIPPALANTGDVALVRGDDGDPSLGLFMGATIRVVTPAGLGVLPRGRAVQAWSSRPKSLAKDAA